MGFLFRAAVVIGIVYMLSPERDPGAPAPRLDAAEVQKELRKAAGSAATAAITACSADPACTTGAARLAAGAASLAATPSTVPEPPRRPPEPPERPRPAR